MEMENKFVEQLVGLAEFYSRTLTANQIEMYIEDIREELTLDDFLFAVKKYRRNPEHKFFPLPSQLIEQIKPFVRATDMADDGREVANLILTAVARFGYTNPLPAEEYIGVLGWIVVSRMGGWRHLCEIINNDNVPMYRAQIRDFAITMGKKSHHGQLEKKPELHESGKEIKNLISSSIKNL